MKARKIRQPSHSHLNVFALRQQQQSHAILRSESAINKKLPVLTSHKLSSVSTLSKVGGESRFPRLSQSGCSASAAVKDQSAHAAAVQQQNLLTPVSISRLKQIRRALQHKHQHKKSLCKVFDRWDRGLKGGLDSTDIVGMLGQLGLAVTEDEAKGFVREVQPNSSLMNLDSFLRMVTQPKRKSYYSQKIFMPLQTRQTDEIDQAGGYLKVYKEKYDAGGSEHAQPSPSGAQVEGMRSQLLEKYHLAPKDFKVGPSRQPFNVLLTENVSKCQTSLAKSMVVDKADPIVQKELKALDGELYAGSASSYKLFHKLGLSKSGYLTRQDLLETLGKKDNLNAVSKIFDGMDPQGMNYSAFSQVFFSGMGTEGNNQMYPRLKEHTVQRQLLEKSRDIKNKSIADTLDPKSMVLEGTVWLHSDQHKTRFNATPAFTPSHLYGENESCMRSGDLNEKVRHQAQHHTKQQSVDLARLQKIRQHREHQARQLASIEAEKDRKTALRLQSWRLQAWAYEHMSQLRNEWI